MSKITLEEFFKEDAERVIECTTKEQSDAVRQAFHAMGKRWSSGASFLELDYWGDGCTYLHYSNGCRKGTQRPADDWEVYSFADITDFSSSVEIIPETDPKQPSVLLRSDYLWHNVCWDGQTKHFYLNGKAVQQTNIIAIENDPRTKYVQCTRCGSIIKNTKKAINAHTQLALSDKACLTCKYLNCKDKAEQKVSFVKNDDKTYTKTTKNECLLSCNYYYYYPSIDSAVAREHCVYKKCDANTVAPIDDLFIKCPGVFDEMATADALDMKRWEVYSKHYDNSVTLKYLGIYNIQIHITNLGIVDYMKCYYRNNTYTLVYSKKYDKIFTFEWGEYSEVTEANSSFSTRYYNELMKIMRNIYKGEN